MARFLWILGTLLLVAGTLGLLVLGEVPLPVPLSGIGAFSAIVPSFFLPRGLISPAAEHIPFLSGTGVALVYFVPAGILLVAGMTWDLVKRRRNRSSVRQQAEDDPARPPEA